MQRRVDRRHRAARAEARVVEQGDHVVLPRRAPRRRAPSRAAVRGRQGRAQSAVSVPRSPPDPFTASTVRASPVIGSSRSTLADVLPPPKFVTRGSAPSRRDRSTSATISGCSSGLTRHRRSSLRGCRRPPRCRAASAGGRSGTSLSAVYAKGTSRGSSTPANWVASVSRMWRVRRGPTVTSTGPTGSRSSKKKVRLTTAGWLPGVEQAGALVALDAMGGVTWEIGVRHVPASPTARFVVHRCLRPRVQAGRVAPGLSRVFPRS